MLGKEILDASGEVTGVGRACRTQQGCHHDDRKARERFRASRLRHGIGPARLVKPSRPPGTGEHTSAGTLGPLMPTIWRHCTGFNRL